MKKIPTYLDNEFLIQKINDYIGKSLFELAEIATNHNIDSFSSVLAQAILKSHGRGEFATMKSLLDTAKLHWKEMSVHEENIPVKRAKRSFEEFCKIAGYNPAYPKQEEMREFIIEVDGVRMLLGSRGYGKTDYAVILGYAYKMYCEWCDGEVQDSCIIITKSDKKNAQIMREISRILAANEVPMSTDNAEAIRIEGLIGKDDSLCAVTIGSASFRGRHPKRIIFDDPVTPEDTSETVRERAKAVYNEAFKLCGNIAIIGQPAHKFDLYQELRDKINCMEVPHGTIPELDHDLDAQRLGGVDEDSIQASYHLKVSNENASPFAMAGSIDAFPTSGAVAYIDPSFKGIDYTAMSVISGYFSGVAVEGYVRKKAWQHCIEEYLTICKKLNVKKLCIECNSLGDTPLDLIRAKVKEMGLGIGVMGRTSTTDKHADIVNAGTFAESIYLSKKSDKLYIEQVTKYEYKSKFDDAPDSLARGLMWIGIVKTKGK